MHTGVLVVLAVGMAIPALALLIGLAWPGENDRRAFVVSLLSLGSVPVAVLLSIPFAPEWRFFWLWVWIALFLVVEYAFVLPLFGPKGGSNSAGSS